MRNKHAFMALVFALSFSSTGCVAKSSGSEEIFSTRWDGGTKEMFITVSKRIVDGVPMRTLTISEVDSKKVLFEETDGDNFQAGFATKDVGGRLVLVWQGGSAYRIEVLSESKQGVERKLTFGSRSMPELILGNDGNEVLIASTASDRTIFDFYSWNGSNFDTATSVPKNEKLKTVGKYWR